MKKTWKDLQHGDVIDCDGTKKTIDDISPLAQMLRIESTWYSFDFLRKLGWQIVQPEEEEKDIEATITEKLLNDCNEVLGLIPRCPLHGFCLPHFEEWINKAKPLMDIYDLDRNNI